MRTEELSRAFQNVVSNCAGYARSRVEVFLAEEDAWHVICVEDDGPGLSEKDLPHIFERWKMSAGKKRIDKLDNSNYY